MINVRTSVMDAGNYDIAIPMGKVANVTSINKFGRREDIDTATDPATVWGGVAATWVPPTEARIHAIVSSSTADAGTQLSAGTVTAPSTTALIDTGATFSTDTVAVNDMVINTTTNEHSYVTAVVGETELSLAELHHNGQFSVGDSYIVVTSAGTGAAVLHIKNGIGSDKGFKQEYVVLNGTTPVNTVNEFYRINRAHVGVCGSNGTNVGDIDCTAATDATVTAHISADAGQTLMAVYTVPSGYEVLMTNVWASMQRAGSSRQVKASLRTVPYALENAHGKRIDMTFEMNSSGSSHFSKTYRPFRKFEAMTDIILQVDEVSANDTGVSGGFDLLLVKDVG